MQSQKTLFSPPNIPSLWLDRAIKQHFTDAGTRALAHTGQNVGSGWLYRLQGQTYYSPTCLRPDVKVPRDFEETNASLGTSTHYHEFERYQSPQWWSKASSYLGFIPIRPDLSAPPLYPLLCHPDVLDSAEFGPHPDPGQWSRWQHLQDALVEATHLLLKDSGAAAVRSMPYPCARVDRNVECKAYIGRKAQLYRDISLARSLFEVWFGCLSYAIAVNEAVINQVNAFRLSSKACIPLSWVELILAPYQERKKGATALLASACTHPRARGAMAHTGELNSQHDRQNEPSSQDVTELRNGGIIDPTFASSLRNTCIANFDGSVERVGLFIKIPERPEEMISIDWLLECKVPVCRGTLGNPAFHLIWFQPLPTPLPVATTNRWVIWSPSWNPFLNPNVPSTMEPRIAPYEKRQELRECEKNWEPFFEAADLKERLLIQMETPEMKQEREMRSRNPPTTRPDAKFYVWERGMRGTFKRRVARDEELEGIFEEKGKFGRRQARYSSFYNEWDLCRYWGPPDDEQLLHRAKVRAHLRGTPVEGELLWWRVYYGLQPEPLSSEIESTPEDPTTITAEPLGDLVWVQSPSHQNTLEQSSPDKDAVKGNGHDIGGALYEMEDGELEDTETDVSWIVQHAYHFLGFTMCPGSPDSEATLPIKPELEIPAHAPRLVGGQGTGQFWASREGQAIIHFARRLASNPNPPETFSWDLSRWNATPVTSLPLFKRLNFFRGQVIVQVEGWDNVRGRSTPELIPRMETAYWLDIASDQSLTAWYIGAVTPELALALCRIGSSRWDSNPVSIAWYLATKGVPFQTWFKRRAEQIRPSTSIRISPELIQFRLESQYTFGERDYQEYIRCRRRLLEGPAGRAAVKMGGIIWRLATEDIGIRDVLSGVPSEEVLCGQRVVRRDGEGGFLVDDGLNLDEIMAICGEYEVGIDEGYQKGRRSWWPPPDLWEECHGSTGWSSFAELFFQSRMAEIQKTFKPIARSGWRKRLHPSASLRKARETVRTQSAVLFGKAVEGGI